MNRRRVLSIGATLLLAAPLAPVRAQTPHTHRHSFADAEKWAKVFDDPQRDSWQQPQEVIRALGLNPGARVADIGAGTGYFATRLARALPEGRVYAIDTEPDMVKFLASRTKREGLTNVVPLLASAGDPRLPEAVDLVILVDVYHHIEARERYFQSLRAALKPGGRIAIVDCRLDAPVGPPRSARIAPQQVKTELERAGYTLGAEHEFLPHQYFLMFEPVKR